MIRFPQTASRYLFGLCCAWTLLFLNFSAARAQDVEDLRIDSLLDASKAVVYIEAVGTFMPPAEERREVYVSQGSGFLIGPEGLIVTNAHVVNGGEIFYVRINGDAVQYNARLVGISECADLAVLALEANGHMLSLPYLEFETGEVQLRAQVAAFGFPLGADEIVRTSGRITAVPQRADTRWASVYGVIGHSAKLEPGSSGGPLLDRAGKVIGINYAGSAEDREYAAIGSASALPILELLRSGQDLYSLGINGEAVEGDGAGDSIWVVSVKPGSAADQAGLVAGDRIVELADLPVGEYGSMDVYCDIIRSHDPNDVLPLAVQRGAKGELWRGQLNGRPLTATTPVTADAADAADATAREGRLAVGGRQNGAKANGDAYERISDETGTITIFAPPGWQLAGSEPVQVGTARVGAMLGAIGPFEDDQDSSFPTIAVVVRLALDGIDEENDLGGFRPDDNCRRTGRDEVNFTDYKGLMYTWADCGEDGNETIYVYGLTPDLTPDVFVALILTQPEEIAVEPATILAPLTESLTQWSEIVSVPQAVILADILNLRADPGTQSEIIGQLPSGVAVEVWGVDEWPNYTWLYVWTEAGWGWIAADAEYVELEANALEGCSADTCVMKE